MPRFEDFFQRIHPDDQPGFRELIQKAIREKAEWEVDYRIVHLDGTRSGRIHAVGHPVLSTSGDLVEFVGTVIDVTTSVNERRGGTAQKLKLELRQILDLTPQQVGVFGPGGERPSMPIAMALGITSGLSHRRVASQSSHPKFISFIQMIVNAFSARKKSSDFLMGAAHSVARHEAAELLNAQERREVIAGFWPVLTHLKMKAGQITRWYGAATDIEERKLAEERLRNENIARREEISNASRFEENVGSSPALRTVTSSHCQSRPNRLHRTHHGARPEQARNSLPVRFIVTRRRCSGPFVSVNCGAAIPRDLIASELFGHEKGAFTGALQRRLGKFEVAEGGTIVFLDEVGELPAETQIALLRVLQEREFERVGGNQTIPADVRVIAATNRDLQAAISAGTFRSDLFYRLNVFPIEVPPLRVRREDIPMLVGYFIDRFARQAGKKIKSIDKKTLALVEAYPWPGNIRELQNVIETVRRSLDYDRWRPSQSTRVGSRLVRLRFVR